MGDIGFFWSEKFFMEEERKNTPARIEQVKKELNARRKFQFTKFKNEYGYTQMIILKDIYFTSFCAHHLLPFVGKAHIGYIPRSEICGISKLARIVEKFAAKPQIQERMTQEIVNFLEENLHPLGVGVIIEAEHLCITSRGIKKEKAIMITSAMKGVFEEPKVKEEFLWLIKGGGGSGR